MTLLRDIQNSAIDSNAKLSDLLRKCKVLAARLKNEEFKKWVDAELNGYSSIDDLPNYRVVDASARGHLAGPFQAEMRNITIPASCLPEKLRDWAKRSYLIEPISSLEDLVKSEDGTINCDWPGDLIASVQAKIYRGFNLYAAWQVIPKGAIIAILDTVRNRILSFVLEIEEEAPDAGEAPPGSQPLPQERVNQVFNTFIIGSVGSIATGGSGIKQTNILNVQQGNFESLKSLLIQNGLTEEVLSELQESLEIDSQSTEKGQIGEKTSGWIGKMLKKAASGAWEIGTSVAGEILTKSISGYLGLST
jgi:hypothetical protein